MCSIEINCYNGAVMAATLANGGVCPITGDEVGMAVILSPPTDWNVVGVQSHCCEGYTNINAHLWNVRLVG